MFLPRLAFSGIMRIALLLEKAEKTYFSPKLFFYITIHALYFPPIIISAFKARPGYRVVNNKQQTLTPGQYLLL